MNSLRLQVQMQLAGLLTARKQLNEELRECMPLYIGLRHLARQHLRVCTLVDDYRTNLREEHLLMLDFVSTMYKHVRSDSLCMCGSWHTGLASARTRRRSPCWDSSTRYKHVCPRTSWFGRRLC